MGKKGGKGMLKSTELYIYMFKSLQKRAKKDDLQCTHLSFAEKR